MPDVHKKTTGSTSGRFRDRIRGRARLVSVATGYNRPHPPAAQQASGKADGVFRYTQLHQLGRLSTDSLNASTFNRYVVTSDLNHFSPEADLYIQFSPWSFRTHLENI